MSAVGNHVAPSTENIPVFIDVPDWLIENVAKRVLEHPQFAASTRYVSKAKLAERLGVNERTVKTWRSKGLPGVKVGREVMYEIAEVERWIEEQS